MLWFFREFMIKENKNYIRKKCVYTQKRGVRMIERPRYIEKLVSYKDNGRVKIITGIRRCGKSYLLN